MSSEDENIDEDIIADICLVGYAVLGALIKYFTAYPCESYFDIRTYIGYVSIIYIGFGAVVGLFWYICRNRRRAKAAQGIVTGLSIGFGGMTIYVLLNPCT